MTEKDTLATPFAEEPVGRILQRAAKRFRHLGDENLLNHGITMSQLKVIAFISRKEEDAVYQKELEEAFEIRRSSVAEILKKMEKSGLIQRESVPGDARAKRLSLTDRGRELDESLRSFIVSLEEEMLQGFSPEERESLKGYLVRLIENLEKIERSRV